LQNAVTRPAVFDVLVGGQLPVAANADSSLGPDKRVRGRKALDVGEKRRGRILVPPENQEVSDRLLVQSCRDARVLPQARECVAEDQPVSGDGIVEGLDAKVIAGTEEPSRGTVPDGKREVTQQVFHAAFTPGPVGIEDQLGIGTSANAATRFQPTHQILPRVEPGVGGDPDVPVQTAGLPMRAGFVGGLEQGMAKANGTRGPAFLPVGAAKGQEVGQAPQGVEINGHTVPVNHSNDAAHDGSACETMGRSNAMKFRRSSS
jgi:hypothetical protein